MTRAEVMRDYEVSGGIIRSPGMFECEAIYIPHFWNCYLEGWADSDDGSVITFHVTEEDKAEFPELKRRRVVALFQDEQGFVCET